jgi:outer membrane lipoprotein SlyB
VIKGLALRLTTSLDAGAVARSLLGVLAMATVALYLGSPAAAMLAAGAGAIAGASALQETPNRRVSLVVAVSLELGVAASWAH